MVFRNPMLALVIFPVDIKSYNPGLYTLIYQCL